MTTKHQSPNLQNKIRFGFRSRTKIRLRKI